MDMSELEKIEAAQILRNAAKHFEREDSWVQNVFYARRYPNEAIQFCLRGALYNAAGVKLFTEEMFSDRMRGLHGLVAQAIGVPPAFGHRVEDSVATWNNERGRTQAQVRKALLRAAELAEV
jgi:hypothetical protein